MDLSTLTPGQRLAVTTLDRPLFVSAGAGSGKTLTLTKRIIWALSPESGPFLSSIDEVLAITFTNKAAAELRERVRRALMEEGMVEQAQRVDAAWISTIHGMCARMLRAHALDLSLDPSFSVLGYADELKERALDRVLEEFEDAGRAYPRLRAAFRLTGGGGGFGGEASIASMAQRLLAAVAGRAEGLDALSWVRMRSDTADLADAYRMMLATPGLTPKAQETCRAGIAAVEAYEASEKREEDLLDFMRSAGKPASSAATAELLPYLRAVRSETLLSCYIARDAGASEELADLARRLFDAYEDLKREQGGLDNDDLLRLAHRALTEHPEIARAYAGRFKMVMIDEFQDTSAQQVELVERLCGPDRRELCTVGDAQQSIYRFRGADVSVFRDQERRIAGGTGPGKLVSLAQNFRSHADVLAYVREIFGGDGGLMPGFLDLEACPTRRDGYRARGLSRRQAVLVVGGRAEERAAARARAVARRFAAFRDAGQPVEDMVLLLGGMTFADVYADAIRAEGMACIVAGGTVFASAVEVRAVAALLRFLADPADSRGGLLPVLASPLFALGADELLALATVREEDGSVRRANIDATVLSGGASASVTAHPAAARAVHVLGCAAAQVGRRPVAAIVRETVAASGWMDRLERAGAEGLAVAANVLKALGLVERLEREAPGAPRALSDLFEKHLELAKEAPGALTGEGAGAVRIMTVHASKGLEFPVVAVAECYAARDAKGPLLTQETPAGVRACLAGSTFDGALKKQVAGLKADLKKARVDGGDTGGGDSAWSVFEEMAADGLRLDLEERARLLYVAMTRAEEALVLVLDAGVKRGRSAELDLDPAANLVGPILDRILPDGAPLDTDRLAFEGSAPGDYELVVCSEASYRGVCFEPSEQGGDPCSSRAAGGADGPFPLGGDVEDVRLSATPPGPRDVYSYSSLARERAGSPVRVDPAHPAAAEEGFRPDGEPVAFGNAFHLLAQWLVETGSEQVPRSRVEAAARRWGLAEGQRGRLEEAIGRWERSDLRAEARRWPCLRAEVPFFCPGERGRGMYVEGAIDLLCTDPDRPGEAFAVDYKTGGTGGETPCELAERHRLQAEVYAEALRACGYDRVELAFACVEHEDAGRPGEPRCVRYRF